MSYKVVGVVYEIDSQKNAPGRFTVPEGVCTYLGIDKGARVQVEVDSGSGHHGPTTRELKSDREPSPVGEMADWMQKGERIRVIVTTA